MSGFSLHPLEAQDLLDQRVGDPATRDEGPGAGFLQGSLSATGKGLVAAVAGTRAVADTVNQYLPDSFFEDDDKPLLPTTSEERQYGGIRASSRPNPAAMGALLQDLRPDPQTTGILGQVTYGLGSILPPAIIGGAVGGPVGAAAALGTVSGVSDYQLGMADGLDPTTAQARGVLTGGVNAAGAFLPASLGTSILTRIGSGVALNTSLGVAQREATSALLRANGYDEMADQYHAFSGTEMLIDAVAGAAFGALPSGEHSATVKGGEEVPPAAPPFGGSADVGGGEQPPGAAPPTPPSSSAETTPAARVLPSDIDLSLSANAMNQFELDAAPGVLATPAARNGHVRAMDTAFAQLSRDEPVDVKGLVNGEMLPKPQDNALDQALNDALAEGGYHDLLREAEALRGEAKQNNVKLGEDLTEAPVNLNTGDLYQRAIDLNGMSPASHPFYDQARGIHQLAAEGRQVMQNFQLFNRASAKAVQEITNWPSRPLNLMDWIVEMGGIESGLSGDEAADMRARRVPLTEHYAGEVRDLFDGRKRMMNKYVKHDGLSIEDELPNLAAEQGYLGPALLEYDYREAHPDELQQRFVQALKKGVGGKPIYDYRVEEALDTALAENEAKQGLDKADAADSWMDELNRYGLPSKQPSVPEIAEALAKRDEAIKAAEASTPPKTAQQLEDEAYADIPFMRAPEVQAQFPKPVDESDVNPLGFYSQLSRVAHTKLPGKGTGKDFAKALDAYAKGGDFKPEELEYSGVKEWLSTQDKVSKGEVLDFIRNGGVKLEEVTNTNGLPDQNVGMGEGPFADVPVPNERQTKYSKWTLPGGENYREVLLTLPGVGESNFDKMLRQLNEVKDEYGSPLPGREEEFRNLNRQIRDYQQRPVSQLERGASAYQSSHWEQKNVLAHFRLADHVDAKGNKVMLIEEIQSDWHQEGRKKGYKGAESTGPLAAKVFFGITDEDWNAMEPERHQGYLDEMNSDEQHIRDAKRAMVPDAPFKKTWAELSIKRILRMAAEKGYQKVAWTTGEMQAERYDLSKQVDSVRTLMEPNGTYKVDVSKDGGTVLHENGVSPQRLEDLIGKELAQKIVNYHQEKPEGLGNFSGLDLKVGGEGMKGFYDDILPKTVGKVIGKLDKAAKVGEVKLPEPAKHTDSEIKAMSDAELLQNLNAPVGKGGISVHGFDMTDELRDRVMMGLPQFLRASGGTLPEGAERVAAGIATKAPEGMSPDDMLVAQEVNNTVARMLPGAEVRMAGKLYSTGEAGKAGEVFGAYRRPLNVRESRGVVDWSLAAPDAVGVARHEVLHGLRETGLFKLVEWDALTTAARDEDWIGQAKLPEGYKPEQLLEEAIAEKFRTWRRADPDTRVRSLSSVAYKAFTRLERLLGKVGEMARRYMGLKPSADDVFSRIESGEVGKREAGAEQSTFAVTQAEQILADTPDLRIPDEDGGYVDGKLAMMDASADGIRAEQFGPLYEVAVNCFQRG